VSGVAAWRALLVCVLLAGAAAWPPAPLAGQPSGYVPHRVYDTRSGTFADLEAVAAEASRADVVYFGEQHGHEPGHRLQHALLESMTRRSGVILSLEMFERDVTGRLAAYLSGGIDEEALLAGARPWPRYATDYRPVVEHARRLGWPVLAANVPRAIASAVARSGLAALDSLTTAERAWVAASIDCPDDAYRARFITEMQRHPMGPPLPPAEEQARLQRYYLSQCVKDETMAETIAGVLASAAGRPVVHLSGAFHSDHGDGIPARLARRVPGVRQLLLTVVPVPDLDAVEPGPQRARADYLIFTLAAPPNEPRHLRTPEGP
jgi:uncharacterized iron-regulated protein